MKKMLIILALLLSLALLTAEQITVGADSNEIRLLQAQPENMVLELNFANFERESLQIDGQTYYDLSVKNGGLTLERGLPQLPVMAASVIIPNTAKMQLEILSSEYVDLDMKVAPSKGNLTRDIDPATVPHSFGSFYQSDGFWPASQAELSEPFILRDYRGITVRFTPFSYFPAEGKLRVFTNIKVALSSNGTDLTNSLSTSKNRHSKEFEGIYQNMFLNFNTSKYTSLAEEGRILVIKHSMFDAAIVPWVEWKRQNGYTVDIVDVTVAGPSASGIKTYIQNQYNQNDGLTFVQIMGDAPQVPSLTHLAGGSDPSYALLAGSDNYPDIFISRFSAENVTDMQTQVRKVVEYERDLGPADTWIPKVIGIASNEGGGSQGDNGESDQQHMEIIRGKLMNYGYNTVDQLYQTQGATATHVSNSVNNGRSFINYVGHGLDNSWGTTGFNNNNVNQLTNDDMLPFIVSVACLNGNFVSRTCFAEAWLRAKNNSTGNPTGAVAMYASTVNQSWSPPMRAQDEIVDLLVAESKRTIGGLFYNGSSRMIEVYGNNGADEYKNWHIFGDASMMARTKTPLPLTASHMENLLLGMNNFAVTTVPGARVTLYADGVVYAHGIADASGLADLSLLVLPEEPMDLTLTVTAFNYESLVETVSVIPADGSYICLGDMSIVDGNNNIPEYGETITVHFDLNNVGNDNAENVLMSLTVDSPYISVLNGQDQVGVIEAHGSGRTVEGFDLQIAANVPDQHVVGMQLHIVTAAAEEFTYSRNLIVNAPNLEFGQVAIDDFMGNNNQALDPGEMAIIRFPIINNGHAKAYNLSGFMVVSDVFHVAEPMDVAFSSLDAGEETHLSYSVTFSSQLPQGTIVNITTMVTSGQYTSARTYSLSLGQVQETFENGLNQFPWEFTNGEWTPTAGTSYNGSMAAQSPMINHAQTTSMSVTLSSDMPGFVSFWKKVSSEYNYDWLKFYINDELKDRWSGTNDVWSQVTYSVPAGMNTYKWEYSKDNSTSSLQDCAWIDDIVFPTTGGIMDPPVIDVSETELDFGAVSVGETLSLPLTINNSGSSVLIGNATIRAPFCLIDAVGEAQQYMNIIVPPESFLQLNVAFVPTQGGEFSESLTLNTDATSSTVVINLMGEANVVSNDDNVQQAITALKGNFPNPFNPSTEIAYSLKEAGKVKIEIYNLKGQLVKTLINDTMPQGEHRITWNGKDQRGNGVSSGIYFYKMKVGGYTGTRKMMLMK
jgi:hypothetical protein